MKALRISSFGGPEVLRIEDVAPPALQHGQALVRVRAAGINRADLLQRQGHYPAPPDAPPDIPGMEFAGVVAETTSDRVATGQRVFGLCSGGAQAEFVAVAASLLVPPPASTDDLTAAGIAEAFITAHDALITQGGLESGDHVLIHAVASAVGIAAVQLAARLHCEIFGTGRTGWKLERLREYGLTYPLLSQGDWVEQIQKQTNGEGVDLVLDMLGGSYFERSIGLLATCGRLVSLASMGGSKVSLHLSTLRRNRLRLIGSVLRSRSLVEKTSATEAFVLDCLPAIAAGHLRMPIDKTFPLEQAAEAHRYVESNAGLGKVILTL